ncbi:hypothetical protein FSP39_012540 [Pinctada imbricata]|uniref:L-aminoadipate-semialdehyde dehydrogenase-phosphopantetheinyl transferase n=1 Tax=Pinctada imbricata TaxID=66713 RepID=A0AA88Y873_PINIB|nr:hypothetical protein FSP39_012540 [Pinctada imbricata]
MSSIRWAFNFRTWCPTQAEWLFCNQCIQNEERERIHRFMFKKDAKAALIGRLLLRKAVADLTPIPYQSILLGRTDKGKPYLLNELDTEYKDLSFNVSHQGEYAVIAAEVDHMVGVDVMGYEKKKSTDEFFHTMRRQFTDQEWKTIRSKQLEYDQLKMFYRYWCLKESYIKAIGIGIGFEVSRLNFLIQSDFQHDTVVMDTKLHVDDAMATDWRFEEHELNEHCIAVAAKVYKDPNLKEDHKGTPFSVLSYQELIKNATPLCDIPTDCHYWQQFSAKPETPADMKR